MAKRNKIQIEDVMCKEIDLTEEIETFKFICYPLTNSEGHHNINMKTALVKNLSSLKLNLQLVKGMTGKNCTIKDHISTLEQGLADFFLKDRKVSICRSLGHKVSVTTIQFCPHILKGATDNR